MDCKFHGMMRNMHRQTTIRHAVETEGAGLHSGSPVKLRLLPGAPGQGIEFRRTDLEGFRVQAAADNIARVSYATSLMKKGVFISTTEHLLAALTGCEIDNVTVEIDNLELPILDGSAQPYMEMLGRAQPRLQRRARTYLEILEPLELEEGGKFIGVYPGRGWQLAYEINFPHPAIGRQRFELELTPESFRRELAPARTFGFLRDVEAMRRQGLIRGGGFENAVVLDERRVVNGPLRFDDEFVRHKMLDLIGDLALLGMPMLGRVHADKAGHALHTALVKRLLRQRSSWRTVTAQLAPGRAAETPARPTTAELRAFAAGPENDASAPPPRQI